MDTDLGGRRLTDRYLLEKELASGGMGTLWLARDEVLGRPVAIKVLHGHLADDQELLDRFRMEAVAAARLSHPAVVRVFDTGTSGGVVFIVMELVEGETVADILAGRGALPPGEATLIARGVLQGLAHAHREGVVHRDVKPGNIFLARGDQVKLSDFGIAKAAFAEPDLTTTGNLLGTSRYLSPEQVSGGDVDERSDLYAVGLVLYEMLTGQPPFRAETHIGTATMRLTHDPAPPGSLRPGIPRKLESVVIRALARDPAERFQSAEEMSSAIEQALPGAEPSLPEPPYEEAPPPRSVIRSWVAVPLILALAAALAVGGLVVLEGLDTDGDTSAGPDAVPTAPLAISDAYPHDPLGGDGEHDDVAPLAVDGDATTYWTTEGYNQDLGIEKDGVGLIVELRDQAEVGRLRIATDTPGWEFSVFAAEEPGAFDPAAPPVDGPNTAEESGTYEIETTEARYVLVWITRLVQTDRYRAHINEIDLLPPSG